MRSRRDDVDPQATRERAYALSLCGFGGDDRDERVARRVDRFAAAATGSFVWTRDADGTYRLGRIRGPYRYDADPEAVAVDLVHVRPCEWLPEVFVESAVPPAVIATFGRGGRNFQQTHAAGVGAQTQWIWAAHRGA